MRQTASERLCTSEHPKFSADRVDELGPNHCQRTEVSVIVRKADMEALGPSPASALGNVTWAAVA